MGLKLNINEIAPLLDDAARQLDPGTLDHLHAARRTALNQQKTIAAIPLLSRLHHFATDLGYDSGHHRAAYWGSALLLVAVLAAGIWQWQHTNHDHVALDLAILTDELPVRMYVE